MKGHQSDMREIIFEKTGKQITMDNIRNLEKQIGYELPTDFISFYLEHNGGVPVQYIYWKDDDVYVVEFFLPIDDELYKSCSVNITYDWLCKDGSIIPSDYLPIAEESGGDIYLMKLGDKNKSEIYYWSHEYNEPEEMILEPISEDFASFIEYLTDQHPED